MCLSIDSLAERGNQVPGGNNDQGRHLLSPPMKKAITTDKEWIVLAKLAGPMATTLLGVIAFNLVDTYFIGKIGPVPLAALSFTFPVVMVIGSIAHGLGMGITTAVSRAVGARDKQRQVVLVTWGMVLAVIVVSVFVTAGLLTIEKLFLLMGADGPTLAGIEAYMRIWYPGVLFLVVPMAGSAAIYGLGDTKTPARIISGAVLVNTILDPLLIFGIGPFPELGVAGAAMATVIARGLTFLAVMYVLFFREKTVSFKTREFKDIIDAWREILRVGIPSSLTRVIVPIGSGVLTSMVAAFGPCAVAGFGLATRVELFALVAINALVSIMPVFVGQNWGGGHWRRIRRGFNLANWFSLGYGAFVCLLLLYIAEPIARLISQTPEVVAATVQYLRIVSIAYGLQGSLLLAVATLNILKKALLSTSMILIQTFFICLPLAWLTVDRFGTVGIYGSLTVSFIITGMIGLLLTNRYLKAAEKMSCFI